MRIGVLSGLLGLLVILSFSACTDENDELVTPDVQNNNNDNDNDGRGRGNNGNGNNGGGNNGGGNGGGGNNNQLAALPQDIPEPADNISTPQKILLGRMLFWDPILSGNQDVSCATCHHPNHGYADGIDLSIGVGGQGLGPNRTGGDELVPRNAPTVINTAFNGINQNGNVNPANAEMFWDNRIRSLELQAIQPTLSSAEMRGDAYPEDQTLNVLVGRLNDIAEYRQLFTDAFGNNSITEQNIGRALAAFQRSIIANNAPFDRYMRGEIGAMTQQEIAGMNTFVQVGCADCHNGPMLSDYETHTLGVRENPALPQPDDGAGDFDFRTPTLRNLAFTAPYMHNGEFNTLRQVLDFYDDNNNNSQNPNVNDNDLDNDLRNLDNLNGNDVNEILAFLGALNDPDFDRTIPNRVPSGLPVGGNIGPL